MAYTTTRGEQEILNHWDQTGLPMNATFSGDIEIGAVELKDGTTDTRAVIGFANSAVVGGLALNVADANVKSDTATIAGDTTSIDGKTPALGTAGMTGSVPVTVSTDDPATLALQIMDDWDESDRAKANIIVGQAGVAAFTGAAGATTIRTVSATDDPAVAALEIMDDWDESDRAKANIIVGQAGVAANSGAVGATTIRAVLASDVALPAGTNNIGDVDVVNFPNAAAATFSAIAGVTATTTLLASNASRKNAVIYNNSTAILYMQYSAAAATATATYKLNSQAIFEMPNSVYTGAISGLWDSVNGQAQVTEY